MLNLFIPTKICQHNMYILQLVSLVQSILNITFNFNFLIILNKLGIPWVLFKCSSNQTA